MAIKREFPRAVGTVALAAGNTAATELVTLPIPTGYAGLLHTKVVARLSTGAPMVFYVANSVKNVGGTVTVADSQEFTNLGTTLYTISVGVSGTSARVTAQNIDGSSLAGDWLGSIEGVLTAA